MKNRAHLLTGGNLGDREAFLAAAVKEIEVRCGPVVRASSVYQTAAWGLEDQAPFLNQVIEIETALTAEALLEEVLAIEESIGRVRERRYGPRRIDIDILFYNNDVLHTERLSVPHPEIQNRRFVLVPLTEIAGDLVHPVLQKSVRELLKLCPDNLAVQKFH